MRPIRTAWGHLLHAGFRTLSHPLRHRALVLFGALCLACARDDDPVGPSSFARNVPGGISGRVLGPDGTNICNTVGSGTLLLRLLNPDFVPGSNDGFIGTQDITCPNNRYSLPAASGTAHLRVQLPTDGIDGLPWRNLDEFLVDRQGAKHDVHIVEGTSLGGSATLNGSPFEGAGLTLTYELNSNFGAAFGGSGPDGAWMDFFGRSPFLLQAGVRYQAGCNPVLGTRPTAGAPTGGFLFPDEVSSIDCTMETAATTGFSHTSTRLVVTPMPGDIGGQSFELFDQYGVGWGVQFPVETDTEPAHNQAASHLFVGGLLIGRDPDTVLAGVNVNGEMQCGTTCRDLGLDGTVKFTSTSSTGRQVTWRYSSLNGALEITQTSVDGRRPHDYVLFQVTIRNTSRFTRTFHAGFFGDWDVDFNAADDLGFTDLDGRLMYLVSQGETGIHVGTMLLGAPATGSFFFTAADVPSTFDQVQALSGGLRQETGGPADLRYIQGAGPITLKRGQQRDVWIAVVAGESESQLLANAAAAQADVAGRANAAVEAAGAASTSTATPTARAASGAPLRSICKDCKPR
jgi:hypothetical protein